MRRTDVNEKVQSDITVLDRKFTNLLLSCDILWLLHTCQLQVADLLFCTADGPRKKVNSLNM